MKESELKAKPDSLLVSGDKTFFTLQGEGQSLGRPAVFLRLHLCNLHCSWCDTRYTWDKNLPEYYKEPERWNFDKTLAEISKYPVRRLVITGGEPLLHQRALDNFLDRLDGWQIEIETNGTLLPTQKMIDKEVQFNVSPKLENSGNQPGLRYRPEVLRKFNELPNTTFKFVVTSQEDISEIERIVNECQLDSEKIILMPEGTTQEAQGEHGRAVAELCKEKGWRLVPRLQVLLWGAKRRI